MAKRRLPERVYRSLLRAYPESVRDRFGDEMAELFRARHERARGRGLRSRLGVWVEILGDLTSTPRLSFPFSA